jgi:hypothetical protein
MVRSALIHHVAICSDCGAQCDARNAMAWAHQHARKNDHSVVVEVGYHVTGSSGAAEPRS